MNRQEANRTIVKILAQYVEDFPDIRFHQMLHNLNLTKMVITPTGEVYLEDLYNMESIAALERIAVSEEPEDKAEGSSPSFKEIISFEEMLADDSFGEELTYQEMLEQYDLVENEIMISKAEWNEDGKFYFYCGPSIGNGYVSDSIFIDGYIVAVANRYGFADKMDIQLAENFHGFMCETEEDANQMYVSLIEGFKEDGFKIID